MTVYQNRQKRRSASWNERVIVFSNIGYKRDVCYRSGYLL
jgi:hypothetical protein